MSAYFNTALGISQLAVIMPRRGLPGVQIVVLIAVVLLFVYGYYSFNELKSTLKKSEETVKRVKLEEENLSAQLQGDYCYSYMSI